MSTGLMIILLILSIFITAKVCGILFRNTIGTGMAYITRTFVVWLIVLVVLTGLCSAIGLV